MMEVFSFEQQQLQHEAQTKRPEMDSGTRQVQEAAEREYQKLIDSHNAKLEAERLKRPFPVIAPLVVPDWFSRDAKRLAEQLNVEIESYSKERERQEGISRRQEMLGFDERMGLIRMGCDLLRRLNREWHPVQLAELQRGVDQAAADLKAVQGKLKRAIADLGYREGQLAPGVPIDVEGIVAAHPGTAAAAARLRQATDDWTRIWSTPPHLEALETALAHGQKMMRSIG